MPDVENLMYQTYKKKSIPDDRKITYDVEDVYRMKKLRSEQDATTMWLKFQKELSDFGIYSDYVRTQYYCSFDVKGTRFVTIDRLQELGVVREDYLTGMAEFLKRLPHANHAPGIYKIGSFDSARYHDMAIFIGGILKVEVENSITTYNVYATDFRIINKNERNNGEVISPTVLTERCSALCSEFKLDMAIYDSTGQQSDRVYYLWQLNKLKGIKTLIVPYNYVGGNKQAMFQKLEEKIESVEVFLPNIDDPNIEYKEFLKQFSYFKKEEIGTKIKYQAPQARGFYDDFVVGFAQLAYLPHYLDKCENLGTTANLANDADYDLCFSKWEDSESKKSLRTITNYRSKR